MPKLKFVGETDSRGVPLEYYEGVPARDLDEAEVKALKESNPDLFKAVTRERKTPAGVRPALYQEVAAPKPAAKKGAAKSTSKPASKAAPKPTDEPVAAPVVTEPAIASAEDRRD